MRDTTIRARILTVVNAHEGWLTAAEIAQRAGIGYKQAIDALHTLHGMEKVARQGRKSAARWGRLELTRTTNPFIALEQAFRRFFQ